MGIVWGNKKAILDWFWVSAWHMYQSPWTENQLLMAPQRKLFLFWTAKLDSKSRQVEISGYVWVWTHLQGLFLKFFEKMNPVRILQTRSAILGAARRWSWNFTRHVAYAMHVQPTQLHSDAILSVCLAFVSLLYTFLSHQSDARRAAFSHVGCPGCGSRDVSGGPAITGPSTTPSTPPSF